MVTDVLLVFTCTDFSLYFGCLHVLVLAPVSRGQPLFTMNVAKAGGLKSEEAFHINYLKTF